MTDVEAGNEAESDGGESESSIEGGSEPETEVLGFMNDDTMFDEDKIKKAIINWTADCPNTPRSTVSNLLFHLKQFYPGLPLTASTLEKVNTNVDISNMFNGRYAHFLDWTVALVDYLKSVDYKKKDLGLIINIDGIGLYSDARKYHAFPILIKLPIPYKKIICAGIYISESNKKKNSMAHSNIMLKKFVEDLSELMANGVLINDRSVNVFIDAFVCDRPARTDLKLIVSHVGYYSCERCVQKGSRAGRTVFLDNSSPPRTDENFLDKSFGDHHQPGDISILTTLGVGLVSSFSLDYMHLACLGVCKRLLYRLVQSQRGQTKVHLSEVQINNVNEIIDRVSDYLPSDFNRRLRGGLANVKNWKATEFRTFFLYVGVLAFKECIPLQQYTNFLYFSVSMRVLLSRNQDENMDSVKKLLTNFVLTARKIYGDEFVVGNVHGLLHLPDDYLKWGALDNVSCFEFESYLGQVVKGRLTGRFKPLEQLVRHISVENMREPRKKRRLAKCLPLNNTHVKPGQMGNRDNCVMLEDEVICIVTKYEGDNVSVCELEIKGSLYQSPVDSKLVGIYVVRPANVNKVICKDKILYKMLLVPHHNDFVAFKLLHT